MDHSETVAPRWLAVEGFAHAGCAEAHFLTLRVASVRCSEWGDDVWAFTVGLTHACGSIKYDQVWQALNKAVCEAIIPIHTGAGRGRFACPL